MKIIEVLKFNRELISKLRTAGIRLNDVEYIDLYRDYELMAREGNKVSYVVSFLADKYSISERKVYSLIKHFETDCNKCAV